MLKALACVALIACGHGTAAKPKLPDAPIKVDMLAYMPADTTVVIGLDVAALRKSAMWAKYKPAIDAAFNKQIADIKAKCGFDPLESITTITAGAKGGVEDDAVIVVRGLDKAKTTACVMKQAWPLATATADGEFFTLHHQSGKVNMFTFVDSSTLVLRGSNNPTKDLVKAAATAGSPLRNAADFMADFNKVPPDSTVWMVLTAKGKWMDSLAELGDRPVGLDLAVRVIDSIQIAGRIRLAKPDAAQKVAEAMKQQLVAAAAFITTNIKVETNDVVVTALIKAETIDLLLASMAAGGTDDPTPLEPTKPSNPCGD